MSVCMIAVHYPQPALFDDFVTRVERVAQAGDIRGLLVGFAAFDEREIRPREIYNLASPA